MHFGLSSMKNAFTCVWFVKLYPLLHENIIVTEKSVSLKEIISLEMVIYGNRQIKAFKSFHFSVWASKIVTSADKYNCVCLSLFTKQIFGSVLKSRKKWQCGTQAKTKGKGREKRAAARCYPLLPLQRGHLQKTFLLAPLLCCLVTLQICLVSGGSDLQVGKCCVNTSPAMGGGATASCSGFSSRPRVVACGLPTCPARAQKGTSSPPCSAPKRQERNRPCGSPASG